MTIFSSHYPSKIPPVQRTLTPEQRLVRLERGQRRQGWLLWVVLGVQLLIAAKVFGVQPIDAAAVVLAHAESLDPVIRAQTHYVWNWTGDKQSALAVVGALNIGLSHSPIGASVYPLADGQVLAFNLVQLAPDARDFVKLADALAKLESEDTHFHAVFVDEKDEEIAVAPYTWKDGKTYSYRKTGKKTKYVKSIVAPHLGEVGRKLAALFTPHGSHDDCVPITRADFFVWSALSTLNGGHYYDLRGLKAGETKEADYLDSRGTSEKRVAELRANERIALISKVTGKPRQIEYFRSLAVRPTAGTGLVAITHDPFDEDAPKAEFNALRNLLVLKDSGREVILELSNGFPEYTLFNNQGILVAEAPPNLVVDHNIPRPYTKRLQPAVSCIRCHTPGEGWLEARNLVKPLRAKARVDILDDIKQAAKGKSSFETLVILAGQYDGESEDAFRLGRNSYSQAMLRVAPRYVEQGEHAAKEFGDALTKVIGDYYYTEVNASAMVAEAGLRKPKDLEAGVKQLRYLLPELPLLADGTSPEDPMIALLLAGESIPRTDADLIFPDVALRAIPQIERLRIQKQNEAAEKAKQGAK